MYDIGMYRGDASRRGWYGGTYGDRPAWSEPWVSRLDPEPPPVRQQPKRGGFWGAVLEIGKGLAELGSAWLSMNNPAAPSPVVAGGNLYGWNNRNVLCCWDALTGGIRWQAGQDTGGPRALPAPAVADGVVIVTELEQIRGHALATGAVLWSQTLPGNGSTVLPQGGVAYVVDATGILGAYRIQDGRRLWQTLLVQRENGQRIEPITPCSDGRTLYVAGDFGVSAIDPASRRLLWNQNQDEVTGGVPVVSGGYLYTVSDGGVLDLTTPGGRDYTAGFVTAIRADNGRELWCRELTGQSTISSAAVSSGLVILGDQEGVIHAFDAANGQPHWTYTTGGPVWSSPAIAGNTVFAGSKDQHLYALDVGTGRLRWRYATAAPIVTAPAVGHGFVYTYDSTGSLYAVDAATGRGPAVPAV